jgi:hypothetical protein
MSTTNTDQGATEWRIKDEVIRLREWGTNIVHSLPLPPIDKVFMGTADTCLFRLVDPSGHTSREHARLDRQKGGWTVRDLDSRNGTRFDGTRGAESRLEPGTELGIGSLTLLAESPLLIELRSFLLRLLGWGTDKRVVVDFAIRAIRLAATRRAPLVLCGAGDLTQVAYAIHRHAMGPDRPFVVSDPRRRETHENVRAAENTDTGMAAVQRASGGSLCVWSKRLPRDFAQARTALREPATRVQLIVCVESPRHSKPYHVEPIVVPALRSRAEEVPRIIAEYADDVAAELAASVQLSSADRAWVLKYSASSVSEIEKGTRRLLAIRQHNDNVTAAAKTLGMAPISLFRWIGRRALPGSGAATSSTSRTPSR